MIFPFERCLCLPPPLSSSLTLCFSCPKPTRHHILTSHQFDIVDTCKNRTGRRHCTPARLAPKARSGFHASFSRTSPKSCCFALRPRACRGLNYLLGLIVTLGLRTSWPTLLLTSISLLDILFNFTTTPHSWTTIYQPTRKRHTAHLALLSHGMLS